MNANFPLITVITPTYNRADYLVETIESVLSQGYPNLEYIILDDGSKDNTLEVLKQYKDRIRYESHSNMGETLTVNKGLVMARGEIIGVVNSDDPLLPGAINAAAKLMSENPEILVAYPDWNYIGAKGEVLGTVTVHEFDYAYMIRRHQCYVGPGAFFRKHALEVAEPRDPAFKYVADFDFWLRLGLYGPFKKIPGVYATFRIHPNSASVAHLGEYMASEHILLMQKYFSMALIPEGIKKSKAEAFSWAYRHAALTCKPWSLKRFKYNLQFFRSYPLNIFEIFSIRELAKAVLPPKIRRWLKQFVS
jgi:glycosyltransferase involved in cell wall biosynthesis